MAGHPASLAEVALDAGELETLDQVGVEVGTGLGFSLDRQLDVAVELAGGRIVWSARPYSA